MIGTRAVMYLAVLVVGRDVEDRSCATICSACASQLPSEQCGTTNAIVESPIDITEENYVLFQDQEWLPLKRICDSHAATEASHLSLIPHRFSVTSD